MSVLSVKEIILMEGKMSEFKTDLEIARNASKQPISKIASRKISIDEKDLVPLDILKQA